MCIMIDMIVQSTVENMKTPVYVTQVLIEFSLFLNQDNEMCLKLYLHVCGDFFTCVLLLN